MPTPNKVIWNKKAIKQLLKIDRRYIDKIRQTANKLTDFPDVQIDIKKLQGYESVYRFRIGDYRVIFEWIDGTPKIIEIQAVTKRDEQTYH